MSRRIAQDELALRLLTVADVADLTGLSESAIYRAVANGELSASRLRGRLRILFSDLETWIETNRVHPVDPPRPVSRRTGALRAGAPRPAPPRSNGGAGLRELLRQET